MFVFFLIFDKTVSETPNLTKFFSKFRRVPRLARLGDCKNPKCARFWSKADYSGPFIHEYELFIAVFTQLNM